MAEVKDMTMEETFAQLQATLKSLEAGDLSLEDNFKLYEQGLSLVKAADEKLDAIEKKLIVLEQEAAEQ